MRLEDTGCPLSFPKEMVNDPKPGSFTSKARLSMLIVRWSRLEVLFLSRQQACQCETDQKIRCTI
jgi:hypothetical protein